MKTKRWALIVVACVAWLSCTLPVASAQPQGLDQQAQKTLDATGVKGGLIVHLGCGDGRLTAALHVNDRYLVHGLDTHPDEVAAARKHIQNFGLYGEVSVEAFDGFELPYADNLVNLLIAEDLGRVPRQECMRVLAPNGVLYTKSADKWTKTVKPRPAALDEWTHHLHDAGGNAVATDRVVGPPQHLQWTAGPLWARSHGWTPSVSAMVSTGGRLFYICDETLTCVDGTVPSKWFVVARDAFSGVLLWKRPIPRWGSEAFSGTPDSGRPATVGRFTMPPHLGRRLVAVGETVYVTLGVNAPVTALNAATGTPRRVYAETANADEILCVDGRLVVSLNPPAVTEAASTGKQVCAIDLSTGRVLWKKGPFAAVRATRAQDPFGRLELAAGDGQVFLLTETAIESLNLNSGQTVWRMDRPSLPANAVRQVYPSFGVYEYRLTVMVYHAGVLLLAQPEPNVVHTYHTMPGTLYAFDAGTGRQMWKHHYGGWGHDTQPDLFVVDGVVWTHAHAEAEFPTTGKSWSPLNQGEIAYAIQGLDLKTGEIKTQLSTKDIFNVGHHHRCYRNRSTSQFLMSCRRGVEFVDLSTGENYQNHWVRSGCSLGYLPCNGLLYVTPHPCWCYINAKLTGFNALAPQRQSSEVGSQKSERLEKGPAYGRIGNRQSAIENPDEWPTYRHDPRRSGATESAVSPDLEIAWRADIGTRPSGLVAAGGGVLVAGVDTHSVHALDGHNGKKLWKYTTGARVDSPATVYDGLALFGSADGRVYCLRADDGALVWRFDAAPRYQLLTAFGQLESPWPVPGNVLVHEGKCWFAAGRSSYLDGGIRLYALDPATGNVLRSETIYSPDPQTGKMTPETSANKMDGLLNDIPATDGTSVFIRQMPVWSSGGRGGQHLYSSGGYLDPSWFNRTFWQVGRAQTSGLMVLGKDVAYGVELFASRSRETVFTPGANAYRLRCISLKAPAGNSRGEQGANNRRKAPKPVWEQRIGIRVTALVRAADVIFAAGSPDIVDPDDPHGAWEGRKGGVLAAFAANDGKKLAQYKLPAPPVWDGMAAAGGRLYISTSDGGIVCMGGTQ
ncbi:MAG: PQQ-binding-like beta-propeller repeat protein [Phycisphaerales bacterium]|nr:MAG: PQQ-binding-like beta-propeller repeat protein [Phycisphaerales bacterium]